MSYPRGAGGDRTRQGRSDTLWHIYSLRVGSLARVGKVLSRRWPPAAADDDAAAAAEATVPAPALPALWKQAFAPHLDATRNF